MQEKKHFYPHQLSGGQQQKIAVGRALITHPPLLLADEPTGNLDSSRRNDILKLLHYLNRKRGMTILLVTHDSFVARCADRNIQMQDGYIRKDMVLSGFDKAAPGSGSSGYDTGKRRKYHGKQCGDIVCGDGR